MALSPSAQVLFGKLAKGESVEVVGKVEGKNWYLLSQDGIGQGYGYADGGGGAGGGGGTGAGMGGVGGSFKTGGGIGYQPGADGDFTSNAYARRASMESPYLNTVVGEAAVSKYENDSFYSQLSAEIDYEMYLRRTA